MDDNLARLHEIDNRLSVAADATTGDDRKEAERLLTAYRRLRAKVTDCDERHANLDWTAMVAEFHMATTPGILRSTPGIPEGGPRSNYAMGFIQEEVDELDSACACRDLVKIADALADIIYVTIRASLLLGIDLGPVFAEVHRSNMTKIPGHTVREDGKVLKGPHYSPPDVAAVLARQGPRP